MAGDRRAAALSLRTGPVVPIPSVPLTGPYGAFGTAAPTLPGRASDSP